MSSSTLPATATASGSNNSNSNVMRAPNAQQLSPSTHALGAQFREIHKNTWLKRLTAEGKKITVGPKRSERSWVVFCVHDDTEALLEGYADPRQAPAHSPEWIVSLRHTLHVSHALIPNSHEFEFVVALNNEVVRFHATSWEIMQEWVETLRAKLREMKILSPRENLYTKLPEVRVPLLPTRDPTSPLPAPPPVPAAIVPGVEQVIPHTTTETHAITTTTAATATTTIVENSTTTVATVATTTTTAAMSNTLTQNLLNLLIDPISAYSENLNATEEYRDNEEDELDDELEIVIANNSSHELHSSIELPYLLNETNNCKQLNSNNDNNSVRVDINTTCAKSIIKNATTNMEHQMSK